MKQRLFASQNGKRETFITFSKEGVSRDGKPQYWFSMTTQDGGTENTPYGFTTRERLQDLITELDKMLNG